MTFTKKLSAIALVCFALFTLAACGNEVDKFIDTNESFVNQIEKIAQKDTLTQEDYEEYQKISAEFKKYNNEQGPKLKDAEATPEQKKRVEEMLKKFAGAVMKIEMEHALK